MRRRAPGWHIYGDVRIGAPNAPRADDQVLTAAEAAISRDDYTVHVAANSPVSPIGR